MTRAAIESRVNSPDSRLSIGYQVRLSEPRDYRESIVCSVGVARSRIEMQPHTLGIVTSHVDGT
jgi:hypothetical protein